MDSGELLQIGDICGGFIETAKKTRALVDMMEASIIVKGNVFGFISAVIHLPSLKLFPFIREGGALLLRF